MTFCMNVSRFMNLAAIFSLDLESQDMTLEEERRSKLQMVHRRCTGGASGLVSYTNKSVTEELSQVLTNRKHTSLT